MMHVDAWMANQNVIWMWPNAGLVTFMMIVKELVQVAQAVVYW
jgi:hypothetical protein